MLQRIQRRCDIDHGINQESGEEMNGECEKLSDFKLLIRRIEDIGRARELLSNIMDDEIFENLSKHNRYWTSNYDEENDKLGDLRLRLGFLQEELSNIYAILAEE